jgi:hypothetical protein
VSNPAGKAAMIDGPLRRLFWRLADALAYVRTMAWLRILDALAGPEPETPADQPRQPDRERINRSFPKLDSAEPDDGTAADRTDRVLTDY